MIGDRQPLAHRRLMTATPPGLEVSAAPTISALRVGDTFTIQGTAWNLPASPLTTHVDESDDGQTWTEDAPTPSTADAEKFYRYREVGTGPAGDTEEAVSATIGPMLPEVDPTPDPAVADSIVLVFAGGRTSAYLDATLYADADFYTVVIYEEGTSTVVGLGGCGDTDALGFICDLPTITSPVTRDFVIYARGEGVSYEGTFTQLVNEAISVTVAPQLSVNGGWVTGSIVTVIASQYEGGPLIGPPVYKIYSSNDNFVANEVLLFTYTEPFAVDADWDGLRIRGKEELTDSNGTTTTATAASDEIDGGGTSLPIPPQPQEQDWVVTARAAQPPDDATRYVLEYEWVGAGTPVEVEWLNDPIADFEEPSVYEDLWRPCVQDGDLWVHDTIVGGEFTRVNGNAALHLRIRYKLDASGPFSTTSLDKKIGPTGPTTPPASQAMWHSIALVTDQEAALGRNAGSAGQPAHLCLRSESDPSVIVIYCDVNGILRSEDDGVTFRRPAQKGLFAPFSVTGAIDPTDDRVIFYAGTSLFYPEGDSRVGLYRSTDAGEEFDLVLTKTNMEYFRQTRSVFMDYDRSKRDTQTPDNRTWLAALPAFSGTTAGDWSLYRSDTGGQSWGSPIFTFTQATYGNINYLVSHPSVAGCFYICTNKGVWRTTNYGTSWTNLTGNIPTWASGGTNKAMVIEINPAAGAIASTELYLTVGNTGTNNTGGTGIHRSTNGGAGFTKLTGVPGNPSGLRVARNSSGQWPAVGSRVMYLIGRLTAPRRTADGGSSWTTVTVNGRPYANGTLGGVIWEGAGGNFTYTEILPHPTNPNVVWAHGLSYLFRSINGGTIFNPTGAYVELANWQTGRGCLAFCEGNITGAEDFAFIGVADIGGYISRNAGRSWHVTKVKYPGTLDSINAAAICPNDLDFIIATTGYHNQTSEWMRTEVALPNNYPAGDWEHLGRSDAYPYGAHWHKADPTVCYTSHGRFTNAKVSSAYSAYPSGGYFVEVAPQNNDIIFTKVGNGASTVIHKSTNKGAGFSPFVALTWEPGRDNRKAMIAVDPGDHNIIYMPGPLQGIDRDLRRYNDTMETWKTDYGLHTRFRADNPDYPSDMPARVDRIAVDPQDRDTLAVSIYALSFCAVYITYNATAATPTWADITKNLSRINSPGLKFHPTNGDLWCGFVYGGAFVYPHPTAHADPTWTTNLIVQNVETE